jgi:hypothetical protein
MEAANDSTPALGIRFSPENKADGIEVRLVKKVPGRIN